MENHIFVDNKNILQVTHHDKDCHGDHDNNFDVCNTPNNSVKETTFRTPNQHKLHG